MDEYRAGVMHSEMPLADAVRWSAWLSNLDQYAKFADKMGDPRYQDTTTKPSPEFYKHTWRDVQSTCGIVASSKVRYLQAVCKV